MASYSQYISPKSIIMDYLNQSGATGELNEELIQIFTNRAIDSLLTANSYKEFIILVDVYNHKAELPPNFRYPTQVAYRNFENPILEDREVMNFVVNSMESSCEKEVKIDACTLCKEKVCCCSEKKWYPIKIDSNYVTLSKNPLLATGYSNFMYGGVNAHVNSMDQYSLPSGFQGHPLSDKLKSISNNVKRFSRSRKCPEFQLVRPTSNYFFNLPNKVQACNIPSYDTNLEYKIEDGIISVNNYESYRCNRCAACKSKNHCEYNYAPETKGQLLISYTGRRIDDENWLMLPDEEYIKEAVTLKVMESMALRAYSIKPTQTTRAYWSDMRATASIAMKKAKSKLRIPSIDVWEQFVENHWMKSMPYRDYRRYNNAYMPEGYRLPNQTYMNKRGV